MATYSEIVAQIELLQKQAETLREKEIEEVVERIKKAIAIYQLTPTDLGFEGYNGSRRSSRRKPKFQDSEGNVWSGRGPRPKWFKKALASGVDPESLRVR